MSESKRIREKVWSKLVNVAKPDTRFHLDFNEYIPDFELSEESTKLLIRESAYRESKFAFITPDNCLTDLRRQMIQDGKTFIMSTYGIYRGFILLDPKTVPKGAERYASWLDGMEYFGKPISLTEISKLGRFDLMVTGASAVSKNGVRFGKGHGFFDLEWGMFTDLQLAHEDTPVFAVVHECQIVNENLKPSETDILVDKIVTPSEIQTISQRAKRPHGVKWPLLQPNQIANTPPLQELQRMQGIK